jgi:hypothetical protein
MESSSKVSPLRQEVHEGRSLEGVQAAMMGNK